MSVLTSLWLSLLVSVLADVKSTCSFSSVEQADKACDEGEIEERELREIEALNLELLQVGIRPPFAATATATSAAEIKSDEVMKLLDQVSRAKVDPAMVSAVVEASRAAQQAADAADAAAAAMVGAGLREAADDISASAAENMRKKAEQEAVADMLRDIVEEAEEDFEDEAKRPCARREDDDSEDDDDNDDDDDDEDTVYEDDFLQEASQRTNTSTCPLAAVAGTWKTLAEGTMKILPPKGGNCEHTVAFFSFPDTKIEYQVNVNQSTGAALSLIFKNLKSSTPYFHPGTYDPTADVLVENVAAVGDVSTGEVRQTEGISGLREFHFIRVQTGPGALQKKSKKVHSASKPEHRSPCPIHVLVGNWTSTALGKLTVARPEAGVCDQTTALEEFPAEQHSYLVRVNSTEEGGDVLTLFFIKYDGFEPLFHPAVYNRKTDALMENLAAIGNLTSLEVRPTDGVNGVRRLDWKRVSRPPGRQAHAKAHRHHH